MLARRLTTILPDMPRTAMVPPPVPGVSGMVWSSARRSAITT